ncbi:MAG: ABC-F family ATP-binding cassette domain-containing protein [bacterium]
MLTAKDVTLIFGDKIIFNDISFNISKHQKIGLVGRNGSGKSTLLKVIDKIQNLDDGQISIEKNIKIAYLPQEVTLISTKTILDEALSVFEHDVKLKKELDELENYFHSHQKEHCSEKLERYAQLQHELQDKDIESIIVEAKKMLLSLGFFQNQFEKPVNQLSVGWKMRLVLAKLLLQKADFYLFDEPTNHLDIVAKDWFLDFLQYSRFGFMLVSHDRYFLDHACDYIFDLEMGRLKVYHSNFSKYLEFKQKDKELLESQYKNQQREIKKKEELIDRFRAKASKAKMAQSLIKELGKIELIEIPHEQKSIRINFPPVARSGKIVLQVDGLSKIFDGKTIFKNASFELIRGDKAAIVAANGKGKTTLLNLIMNKYDLETGEFKLGHNVKVAYFEQDQENSLNKNNTVLQEVEGVCKNAEQRGRVRGLLGTFLFSGDDVDKKISVLSGGEKNRVAMVKTLLQDANFLILDEPTNHLDLQSKAILLSALQEYPGTILFVSHDRDFIDRLANKIFELKDDEVITYAGNYESFLYHKKQLEIDSEKKEKDKIEKRESKKENKDIYEKRRELKRIERKIDSLEKELNDLNKRFEILEFGSQEFNETNKKIELIKKELDEYFEKWENFQEEI